PAASMRQLKRASETHGAGHILRAGPAIELLIAPCDLRSEPDAGPRVENAHALRTVHLVSRHRDEVGRDFPRPDRKLPHALHSVGVEHDPTLAGQRADRFDRLDGPDLVVRVLDAD